MAYKLDGKTLIMDRSFIHNEIQYPRNWLQLSTQEEKDAIGVTWEADPVRADDRYYWNGEIDNPKALEDVEEVDENGNPLYIQVWNPETEAMEDTDERLVTKGLKSTKIAEVKHTANTLLAPTDWYVIRLMESEVVMPSKVVDFRAEVKAECDRLETAIAACTDVEGLIDVMQGASWTTL